MGKGLELKVKIFLFENVSVRWRAEQTGPTQSYLKRGSERVAPIFTIIFARNNLFNTILITFQMFSELFERTKSLKLENHSKELNFPSPSPPLHTDQVQNILKS